MTSTASATNSVATTSYPEVQRVGSVSEPSNLGTYAIRPIPLEKSGIPEYMHSIVQSVVGNATLQTARNILIADTNHNDTDLQENIAYCVRGCVESGETVVC